MKNYKKVLAGLCALSCLAVLTACGNKTEKVLELIDSGDFSGALDYYEDEIEGSNKERDQRKEIKNELEDRYEDILTKFGKDEIKEEDLEDFFELIDELKIDTDDEEYADFYSKYNTIIFSKENYATGVEYLENGDYSDAIYYFELITEDEVLYEDAQAKIEEAESGIVTEKLSEVQSYIDSEDYDEAIDLLEYYEDDLKGNAEYERMLSEAESGILVAVKETVDEYFAEYSYYDAYYYLSDMTYYYPDIAEIQTMYDELEKTYTERVLADAESSYASEDYEQAANIVKIAINEIGDDNTELNNAYAEYKSYLPTYINTLEYLACNGSVYSSDVDNTNTEHQYSFYMDGWGEDNYWAEFLINGNYNVFEGICGVSYSERSTTDTKYFEIYGDGKLLYTSPTMTQSVLPEPFSINVTGVQILKISYPATSGSNGIAVIYDGLLSRSDEVQEPATEAPTEAETEAATEEGAEEASTEATEAETSTAE